MARLGFTVVRWFVFCDGRSGIEYDERGLPAGPIAHLFADLDAALDIARDVDIRLVLVLLDHRWMFEGIPDMIADPATGVLLEARLPEGRARCSTHKRPRGAAGRSSSRWSAGTGSPVKRADLGSQIFAFEFMNEPDFVVEEWERDLSAHVTRPLRFEILADLVSRLSALVHRHTRAFSTMAAARMHNLWAWDDEELGLDLVQVHTYPDTNHPSATRRLRMRAASLGMSKLVVLGRVPRRRAAAASGGRVSAADDPRGLSRVRA